MQTVISPDHPLMRQAWTVPAARDHRRCKLPVTGVEVARRLMRDRLYCELQSAMADLLALPVGADVNGYRRVA